ncbi:hypothetical protein RhiirA1_539728 [Rhizophagus irregularis]|uniref:Uncharacterized protein n=1 Tax=Rhizophagus irregularis TaxID=588596 RepID=A0A2N0RBB9_9GLOM|nr:hypothetical protein RhiirA1_539728 [Rhizophagus irregularis]
MITIDRKNSCCLFVPLKAGVNIILFLVFAFGLLKVTSYVRFLISYESSKNSINFAYNVYPIIVVYGLIAIVAAFGLYVTTCANTPNMLSIYSKVFYGIIGFFILYSIMEIVEAITLSIVCTELSYLCGQNHLEIIIPINIVLIILSLYFATFGGLSLTIFGVLNFILYVKNKESKGASKEYSTAATFVFIMVVIYTFITLVAAFGLYAAIFSKKYRMLKLYSIFGYIIVGLQVIISTSVIVSSIISNGGCANYSGENSYVCNQISSYKLPFDIAFGICLILLSVYFSLVISAYARRKKEKEIAVISYLNESPDQTNHNLVVAN